MRLDSILPGQKVIITDMVEAGSFVTRRLLDMGIMEGTEICLKRLLPFGGPLALECGNGQCFCIRLKDAMGIRVDAV